jgi:hypothetical protein
MKEVRKIETPDKILSDEINLKLFLAPKDRVIIINAMYKFYNQKEPKSFITKFKELWKKEVR